MGIKEVMFSIHNWFVPHEVVDNKKKLQRAKEKLDSSGDKLAITLEDMIKNFVDEQKKL